MFVFGWQPTTKTPNALMSAYFKTHNQKTMDVPLYRWGQPTYVRDLAKAIEEMSLSEQSGIYHVCGSSYINRYDWLKKVYAQLDWDTSYLNPQDQVPATGANYPLKARFDTTKFSSTFKTKLHELDDAIKDLCEDVKKTISI